MLKKDSESWRLAKTIARRRHVLAIPVALSDDGQSVTMQGLIRGNTWIVTLAELRKKARKRGVI